MLPLEGTKILDLSRLAPGPFCSMLLGDMGADVLLVEAPAEGKMAATAVFSRGTDAEKQAAYNLMGRNKRSIVLNLREQEAREIFYRLADEADVVLEGFRPGVVKRLGVDYDTLSQRNPRLVYCSLSGFGQTGPYSNLVGHDINYISVGGALGMIGWPGQPPTIPMNIIADFAGGGLHAAFGILTALMARERTGKGQYVEVAMMDGVMNLCRVKFRDHQRLIRQSLSEYSVPTHQGMGAVPRAGNDSGGGQLGNAIHCKPHGPNDWLYVVVQEAVWEGLAKLIGGEALASDPRFAKIVDRRKNQNAMWQLITDFAKNHTKREFMALLNPIDVPCGPIMSTDDLADDEHVRGRDMWVELDHPQRGKWFNVGMPIKLSDSPAKIDRSPTLGEHTEEILKEVLGYEDAKINSLKAAGAFSVPPKKAA